MIIKISGSGIRERFFNKRYVLSEKLGPTNSVRLLLIVLTLSNIGC